MITAIFIGGFLLLLAMGMPIALALIVPSVLYMFYFGYPLPTVAHTLTNALDSFPLLAVPLFVLVGNLMGTSGIAHRLFHFAHLCVAHWRGGMVQVNILASLIFSGSSGSALADIGGMGAVQIRAMKEVGYKGSFAAAVTAVSATTGPIFPPSIPLVIFAATAETSAVKLLMAGILPGILITIFLMGFSAWLARRRGYPTGEKASRSELWDAFVKALPALLTPVVLVAGMTGGVFTATEAAAFTVFYILLITIFIYRDFKFSSLIDSTWETAKTTVVLMIMVAASVLFTRMLALEQVPQMIASGMLTLSDNPLILLLLVNVVVLLVGFFLDTTSAILILAPLIVPPLVAVGVDPTHLGIVVVYNLMIGLITPPMGMSLFLASTVAKEPITAVLRQVLPYYVTLLAVLVLLTYIPAISTWLPSMMMN
ncbi:TRAP transporter large permease [Thalassorhabdomicrobium marinisediminis]|uniref:TRAP transporter large permease n=1 Tax=Thalassorhabdomicrobium marinisediminis TaxID=2170577 RepID=UPI002490B582|nr:TRAP transporter large permease [Thalassorhabdomicrobium marinisediminis]